jgi:hypothetical protein
MARSDLHFEFMPPLNQLQEVRPPFQFTTCTASLGITGQCATNTVTKRPSPRTLGPRSSHEKHGTTADLRALSGYAKFVPPQQAQQTGTRGPDGVRKNCTESIPEWIRTTNLRLRRPTRYPVAPPGQNSKSSCAAATPRPRCERRKVSEFYSVFHSLSRRLGRDVPTACF